MAPTRRNTRAAATPTTTTAATTEAKSSRVTKRRKKDTNAAVTVEPEKKPATRVGRGKKTEVVPESEPEEEKEELAPVKTRKGRGKKESESEPEPEPEPEPEKKMRGRGKKVEAEVEAEKEAEVPAKTRTGRGKKAVQEEEEGLEPEPVKAARGRGRKLEPTPQPKITTTRGGRGKKTVQDEVEEKEEVPDPEPVKATRGRGKKPGPAPELEVSTTRGGRRKKAAEKQQSPASPPPPEQEEEKKKEVQPAPRRGGRGKALVAEPEPEPVVEVPPQKRRGKKQAAADTTPAKELPMEDCESSTIQVVVMTPSKKKDLEAAPKRGGRGKAAVKEPEPEPQPEEEEQVEQTPKRTGRGKTVEKPASRATRRKAGVESEEEPLQHVEPVPEEPEIPALRRGARGKAAPEPEATEEPAPKPRRGRAKSPPPELENAEPAPKTRRDRAKSPPASTSLSAQPRRKSAKASKPEEPAEETVEEPKPRRGRGKAAKTPEPAPEHIEVDTQPEPAPTSKLARRGRSVWEDPTPADEDAVEIDDLEKEPPKSTRKPRRKAVAVAPSPAHASRRGRDKATERIEQQAVLAPNNANNRVMKPARTSHRAASPVHEEEEQQEQNPEELLRPKRPGKRRGRSPSPDEDTKEPASKRAFRRREKMATPARTTFQVEIQSQKSKETEKEEKPDVQPGVEEEQSKAEPQSASEPEMVPEAEVEQIAMEGVPVQQPEEAPEVEEEAEVSEPATIHQDNLVSDATEVATEEATTFEPTFPAVEKPEETEPVETEIEAEVADEPADSEGIVAESENLASKEIQIIVEAPASDAEEDALGDTQDDSVAALADEEEEPELPEPRERDQSRSPSPPGNLPQTVHLGTPVMQSSPSRRLSLPAPPVEMDDDEEPLVASSPRLSPAPKTPHIQKRSSSARSTPRQTDPIQLSSPRRASSGISPTKSPIVPTPSPITVLEPEYDLPTTYAEASPSTPLKRRQPSIGVGSSPIDVAGSPGLSLDPTAPKPSAISPVKHSSPLALSPVVLAEHLGSLSPPSSPVRKHQTRQSSPLKISTPSGATEGPDFLAENDALRSSPIGSPAKKSSPRHSSATPAEIDAPAQEPTPIVGSSPPPQLSDVTNTAPRSREPTPQAPKSDTPKPEKESTPPPPPSVLNARHTQVNTRGEQPPSPIKHAPGIFSAQKLTPKFAVPGSPARSSPKRSVSPKKSFVNKMIMDELDEGDTTFDAWLEGDTNMTEIETRIEGDSACESMVFPDEGDQSIMFTEKMLPDDINDREMDESMNQSSADPFQLEPSDLAQKSRVGDTSWLHGANKLRGSSPLGEESTLDLGDDDDDQEPDEPSFIVPARKSQEQDNDLPSSPIDSSPRERQATASSPNKSSAPMSSPQKKSTPRPPLDRVSHYPTPNPSFETEGNSSIFSTPHLGGEKLTEPGTITGVHEEREISLLEAVTPNFARTKDSFSSSPQIFSSPPQPSPLKSSSPVAMPMVEGENIFDIHMSPIRKGSSIGPSPLKTNISFTEDEAEDMSEIVLANVGTSKNPVLASPPKKLFPTISNPDVFLFSNEEDSGITEGDEAEEDMSFQAPNFRQTTPPSTKSAGTPNSSSPPAFESTPKPASTRTLADTKIPDFGKTTSPRKQRSSSPEPRRALQPQSPKSPFRRQASPAKSRLYMQHNAYSSSPSDTSMFSPVVLPSANQAISAPEVGTPTRTLNESILPGILAGVSAEPISPLRDAEPSTLTLSGFGVVNNPATASPLAQVAAQEEVADEGDESSVFIEDPAQLPELDQPSPIELLPRPTNPTPGRPRSRYNDTSFSSSPFEESVLVASPHELPLKNAGSKRARSSSPIPEADNSTVDFPPSPKKIAFTEHTVFEPSAPVGKIDFSFKPSGNTRHTGTPRKKSYTPKKTDTWFGKLGISPAVTAKRKAAAAAASLAEADGDANSHERKRARVVSPSDEQPPQFEPMMPSSPETKNPEPFTSPTAQETHVAHFEAYEAAVTASVMDVPMEDHAPTTKDAPATDHAGQSEERLRDVLQTGGSEASGETPATMIKNEVEMKEDGDGLGEDEDIEKERPEQEVIEEVKVEEIIDEQIVDDQNIEEEQVEEEISDDGIVDEENVEKVGEEADEEEEQGEEKKESPAAPINAYSTSYLDRFLKKHEKKYQLVSGTASATSILSTTNTVSSNTTPIVAAAAVAPVATTPTPTPRQITPTPRAISEEPAEEKSTDRSIRKKSPIPRIPKPSAKAPGGRDGRSKSPSNIPAPGSGVRVKKATVGGIPRPRASIPVPRSRITKPGRTISSALPIPASAISSAFAVARSPSPAPPPNNESTKPSKLPARARSARVAAASRPTISLAPNPKPCDVASMSWDSLPERERKNITKTNTSLNCTPTPFPRETTKLPIPRPPSPSPTTQHRTATQLRRKREEYLRRTGVELGPGEEYELPDTSDLEDMDSGDEDVCRPMLISNLDGDGEVRKGVKWNTPLEAGFAEELELHSPSKAKLKQPKGPVIQKKIQLDRNGNVVKEGGEEIVITPGTPVVIRKVLYKGESAD